MSLKDMTDLIYIYDGLTEMEKALSIITGSNDAYCFEEGAMGKLSRVMDIIQRNTDLYNPEQDDDIESSEFSKVLDDRSLTPEERAKRIFNR